MISKNIIQELILKYRSTNTSKQENTLKNIKECKIYKASYINLDQEIQNREHEEESRQITTKGTSALKQCNELGKQSIEHVP